MEVDPLLRILRSRLFRATLVLFSAGAVNRVLGIVYRVGLARAVGPEGLGIVQRAFPVFLVFLTLATLGLATGTAKMVADRVARGERGEVERVRRVSLALVLPCVAGAAILLVFTARPVALHVLRDARVTWPLLALVPALAAAGISSVFRGYFQGQERMTPIAVGQIAEQVVRVAAVYVLLAVYLPKDDVWLATLAAAATSLGEWVGLGSLLVSFRRHRLAEQRRAEVPSARTRPRDVARELAGLSWPVALSHLVGSLNSTFDAVLIPARLVAAGLTTAQATAAFGELVGMALPVVYLATVIIHPLASTLVPEIAEAATLGNRAELRSRSRLSFVATLAVGGVMAAALFSFPAWLGGALYGEPGIAPLLTTLSVATPLMYLHMTGTSILNGLGRTSDAMAIGLFGTAARVTLIYALAGVPALGIEGAAIAIGVSHAAAGTLTWIRVGQWLRAA